MSIKYYAHFILRERMPGSMSEYRGVIEVNRASPYADMRGAASILAKNFECDSKDITVLHWSRLH
jgi:hypothetical protein